MNDISRAIFSFQFIEDKNKLQIAESLTTYAKCAMDKEELRQLIETLTKLYNELDAK
jgi:hypothetical protein